MKKWTQLAFVVLSLFLIPSVSADIPVAQFTGAPTNGAAPLLVSFNDLSLGTPTGWAWYFGDESYTEAWTQMTASNWWSARFGHTSVVLPDGSIVLMGGHDSLYAEGNTNDVWRSTDNGATWMLVNASSGWKPRVGHSSVVMQDGSIVLMGGSIGYTTQNDVWRSMDNGSTWMLVNASSGWKPRSFHTSVVMPDGSIILMGGRDGYIGRNDVWRSTDNGATWKLINISAGWMGRYAHSSVTLPDGSIVLMGGYCDICETGYENDVWRSTDNGATWTQVNVNAEWTARNGHNSVVMPDGSIVLMGGFDGYIDKNDVWRSTDNGATWTQVNVNAEWTARHGHSSVVIPDGSIVLMGGLQGYLSKNDVWRFIPFGSSEQNPSHTYTTPGTYSVTLQAYNANGYSSLRKTGYITVISRPVASFSTNVTSGSPPLAVQFTDTSTNNPTMWNWSFGDGTWFNTTDLGQKNPVHVYSAQGTYTAYLTVSNAAGSDTSSGAVITVTMRPPPTASFVTNVSSGFAPLAVQFTDRSIGSPTMWNWSFGDGTWFNTTVLGQKNPVHVYSAQGTYTAYLTVSNVAGSSTSSGTMITVNTLTPPIVKFTTNRISGRAPLTVRFTDQSTGGPTEWRWGFGDGEWFNTTVVARRNPTHTYTIPGSYLAQLIACNAAGCNMTAPKTTITVT